MPTDYILASLIAERDKLNAAIAALNLTARGESRLAQKPGQPPYFANREAPIESMRLCGEIW